MYGVVQITGNVYITIGELVVCLDHNVNRGITMTEKCKAFYDYESCSQEASVAVFGKLNTVLCLEHFARFHKEGFTDYKYFAIGMDEKIIYDFKEFLIAAGCFKIYTL